MTGGNMKAKSFFLGVIVSTAVWLSVIYFEIGRSSVQVASSDIVGDVYIKIAMQDYASESKISLEKLNYLRTPIVVFTSKAAYVELRTNKAVLGPRVTYVFDINETKYREKHQFSFYRTNPSDTWKVGVGGV